MTVRVACDQRVAQGRLTTTRTAQGRPIPRETRRRLSAKTRRRLERQRPAPCRLARRTETAMPPVSRPQCLWSADRNACGQPTVGTGHSAGLGVAPVRSRNRPEERGLPSVTAPGRSAAGAVPMLPANPVAQGFPPPTVLCNSGTVGTGRLVSSATGRGDGGPFCLGLGSIRR